MLGLKVLLPLDDLALPYWYLPPTIAPENINARNAEVEDLVDQFEPARRFAVAEIHQGRFPSWSPFEYCGSPYIWPKFSPFLLLEYTTSSPIILAWAQLAAALVAGLGMYGFCRQALKVSFWPAAIGGWMYPMTAFMVLWTGFPTRLPVCWLPWLFLLIHHTVYQPRFRSAAGLGLVTGLVMVSGNADMGGQVLLGGGIYSLWCLCHLNRDKLGRALTLLVVGWTLGIMLATPYVLPLMEYAHTGARMVERSLGTEERPPVGLGALPQIALPDMYGKRMGFQGMLNPRESNFLESPSAAYIGVIATLLIAPLAWLNPGNRRHNNFWLFLAFFGLSWCLNVPGLVDLLRSPGLNMMSHNRLVFLTAFALMALTVNGLENAIQGRVARRLWFWGPAVILAGLGAWCLWCVNGVLQSSAPNPDAGAIREWYWVHFLAMAILCAIGLGGWLWLWGKKTAPRALFTALVVLWMGDLLWFDHGRCAQSDPKLYYPQIPALSDIAASTPGRVIGLACYPPTLSAVAGLNDVRGYDAIDPARMVALLHMGAEATREPEYGGVQLLIPLWKLSPPDNVRFSPIMDMLNVRYGIGRGSAPDGFQPFAQSPDYCVFINTNARPRVYVPRRVETVADDDEQLQMLSATNFDPAAVAYVSTPVGLPPACVGQVQITNEIPTDIKISVDMKTPGMVVVSDRWDKGWHAQWNGAPVDILQANYAIRGVVLPAGAGTLEFFYRPASLVLGGELAGIAMLILLVMALIRERAAADNSDANSSPSGRPAT